MNNSNNSWVQFNFFFNRAKAHQLLNATIAVTVLSIWFLYLILGNSSKVQVCQLNSITDVLWWCCLNQSWEHCLSLPSPFIVLTHSLCGSPVKSVNLTLVLEHFKHLLAYKLESLHNFVPLSAISREFSCENVQPLLMTVWVQGSPQY